MKKLVSAIFVSLIVIASGCNHEVTVSEEQAKSSVIELRNGNIGKVEILSTELKRGNYLIEWKNEENCEHGVDSVNAETGEIEMITAAIC
ncbi:putative membrane protein YkoI [Planomicrobium koreense]|uniref:Putative membrane protein YkoI n=1 Tax=Planococcus koreensis TaxID=112331 RepID=A0A7W8FTJ2_9BACL|nr:hypothetical protein [Planococcus koreensis]MBB5181118.1 putative membrane protein YkoI [Planococcus koreensis]